jgi:hypothetical protein
VVTDGHVEIRYVIPTTSSSTKTRFCHLRTDYFHLVAPPVAHRIHDWRPATSGAASQASRLLVRPLGDGVGNPTPAQQPPAGRIAVAPVGGQMVRALAGPAPPTRPWHPDRIQQPLQLGALVPLPGGQQHRQRPATAVAGQVDLGRQPASTASQRLVGLGSGAYVAAGSPFGVRAPAACWWTRTTVASATTSQSTRPTASDLVCASASSL